jgi:hypothetical protein
MRPRWGTKRLDWANAPHRIFMHRHKMWISCHAVCGPVGAILAILAGSLCRLLHPTFREFTPPEVG